MPSYTLKTNRPEFTVVDGPFANRTFRHGTVYAEIPPEERKAFEEAGPAAPAEEVKGGKKS